MESGAGIVGDTPLLARVRTRGAPAAALAAFNEARRRAARAARKDVVLPLPSPPAPPGPWRVATCRADALGALATNAKTPAAVDEALGWRRLAYRTDEQAASTTATPLEVELWDGDGWTPLLALHRMSTPHARMIVRVRTAHACLDCASTQELLRADGSLVKATAQGGGDGVGKTRLLHAGAIGAAALAPLARAAFEEGGGAVLDARTAARWGGSWLSLSGPCAEARNGAGESMVPPAVLTAPDAAVHAYWAGLSIGAPDKRKVSVVGKEAAFGALLLATRGGANATIEPLTREGITYEVKHGGGDPAAAGQQQQQQQRDAVVTHGYVSTDRPLMLYALVTASGRAVAGPGTVIISTALAAAAAARAAAERPKTVASYEGGSGGVC